MKILSSLNTSACLALFLSLSLCASIFAEEAGSDPDLLVMKETRWGFDSTIQLMSFVPLSIHLQNAAEIPWTGKIKLTRGVNENRLGLPLELEVSLQPNESRWVQMVPFVIDELEDWSLSWGPEKHHQISLTNLQKGPRPTVLVIDTDAVSPPGGVLRRLPEELFPTSVTATETLRGLIFNSAPFWQGARAQAFIDWLHAGGRVYILHTDNDAFPRFNKPLDFLNSEQQAFAIGLGYVTKIPHTVEAVTIDVARKQIFNDDWINPPPRQRAQFNNYDYNYSSSWNRYAELFKELRPITIYQRRWWLIYLSALVYLLVLIKCYQIGRRNANVSYFYGAFFASVVMFSGLFIGLGQLGASVQNRLRSVSLIKHLHDNVYDVTDWSVASNVNAGDYQLAYNGSGNAFSTCSEMESANGMIHGGRTGTLTLKMPPATLRTLMQRRRMTLDIHQPNLQTIDFSTGSISQLSISTKDCLQHPILKAFAIYRSTIYILEEKQSLLTLTGSQREKSANLLQELSRTPSWGMARNAGLFTIRSLYDVEDHSVKDRYESMLKPLIGNSYGFTNEIDQRRMQLPDQTLRLAIYTEMPSELRCTTSDFPDQRGCALYVYDLPLGN